MPFGSPEELVGHAKQEGVSLICLQFADILGVPKEVMIPITELESALEYGVWFDGSSIEGFARIQESDLFLRPDISTYAVLPWRTPNGKKIARLLCDIYTPENEPFGADPRYILKRMLEEAKKRGYVYKVGPEIEFYLFRRQHTDISRIDGSSYFDVPSEEGRAVVAEAIDALHALGVRTEASHHEVGNGQYEIDITYDDALSIADRTITLKYVVKKVASMYGLHATFMPKPIMGAAGNGMHVHQSLFDDTHKNAFNDPSDSYGLSKLAYNFVAGQMEHVKAMCAVICPTVNSYKRLVSGFEAPVYISWARMNRSALIRVPRWSERKPESARIELRCADPACNPYLAFAVMLAAGLDGIKRKLDPPKPVEENIYMLDSKELSSKNIAQLPNSLFEAINELEMDEVIKSALGELLRRYVQIKRKEWDEFKIQVTNWELQKYLDIY